MSTWRGMLRDVAGIDTVRGIAYQQWHAVLEAIGMLDNASAVALRVEGMDDVVDIETLDQSGDALHALQVKTRNASDTWGRAELLEVLMRWAALPAAQGATFEFVTNGRLGPTGVLVRDALDRARSESTDELSKLLGVDPASPICAQLRGASIRQDAALAGELAGRALRDVLAILPAARTAQDAEDVAEKRVLRLFQALLDRAQRPDPHDRIMTRLEIARTLDVAADQRPSQQWPGALRGRYLDAAKAWHPLSVAPALHEVDRMIRLDGDGGDQDLLALLAGHAAVLAGRTGAGKSTAAANLVRRAAANGKVVVPTVGEAYIPGRLAGLVADSIASILGAPIPVATGAQILADSGATVIIDGASELSNDARDALRAELRAPSASGTGASVVVVGRDVAALRALFPAALAIPAFGLRGLHAAQQRAIAASVVEHVTGGRRAYGVLSDPVSGLVAQIGIALGDAAGNPMLFTMAAELIVAGVEFTNVTSLYGSFVVQLAERTNTADIAIVVRGLGIVFAALLDDERRSADPYTWAVKLDEAASALRPLQTDGAALDRGARQSGLVVARGVGQVVVPLHDSFADYLAATAHADGLAALPEVLRSADEQRLLFANAMHALAPAEVVRVARDLPLVTVRLAADVGTDPDENAPALIEQILAMLLPTREPVTVTLWRTPDRRVVAFRGTATESGWVDDEHGQELLAHVDSTVSTGGALTIAVGLWRQFLRQNLALRMQLPADSPRTVSEAVEAIIRHAEERAVRVREIVTAMFTTTAADAIHAALGPLGIKARVSTPATGPAGIRFPVTYSASGTTDVEPTEASEPDLAAGMTGRTSVEWLLSDSPKNDAIRVIVKAINSLCGLPTGWL